MRAKRAKARQSRRSLRRVRETHSPRQRAASTPASTPEKSFEQSIHFSSFFDFHRLSLPIIGDPRGGRIAKISITLKQNQKIEARFDSSLVKMFKNIFRSYTIFIYRIHSYAAVSGVT